MPTSIGACIVCREHAPAPVSQPFGVGEVGRPVGKDREISDFRYGDRNAIIRPSDVGVLLLRM